MILRRHAIQYRLFNTPASTPSRNSSTSPRAKNIGGQPNRVSPFTSAPASRSKRAILAERATWQKNFSLFRYFGLLPMLEVLPLGVVSRGRRGEPLKGRSQNRNQEIYFNPSASPEELYMQVDKFVAAPPSGFSYPRGPRGAAKV